MKLYRSIDIEEAYNLYKTGYIEPKEFTGNEDSTCPSGKYSFWFNVPVQFEDPFMIVETNTNDYTEYEMTFRITEKPYSYDPYAIPETTEYTIPEFVISNLIKPTKIYFNSLLKYMFKYDMLEITGQENNTDFIKWCESSIILEDDEFIQNRKSVSLRNYGRRYKDIKGKFPCAFRSLKIWLYNNYYTSIYHKYTNKDKSGTAVYQWHNKEICDCCGKECDYYTPDNNHIFCYSCIKQHDPRNKKWDDNYTTIGIKKIKEELCIQ